MSAMRCRASVAAAVCAASAASARARAACAASSADADAAADARACAATAARSAADAATPRPPSDAARLVKLMDELNAAPTIAAVNEIVNREIESNRWDTAGLDKIDTMADHAQEGLYDAERWKGAEPEYKSFKKSLS
jgi:predicted transglutaminase-like cysteine proteinase